MRLRHQEHHLSHMLARFTRAIISYPRSIIFGVLLLTVLSTFYTVEQLGMQTRTDSLFAETLPFRAEKNRLNEAFPTLHDRILVVIEADTPEAANDVMNELHSDLKEATDLFERVSRLNHAPFYRRNALLYLPLPKLESYLSQLTDAQPLLGTLATNPNLQGYLSALNGILKNAEKQPELLERAQPLFKHLLTAIKRTKRQIDKPVSWQRMIHPQSAEHQTTDTMRLLQVDPHLDYSKWLPTREAIHYLRKKIQALEESHPASLSITGGKAMAYEEMKTSSKGAASAAALAFVLVAVILRVALGTWRLSFTAIFTLGVGLLWAAFFAAIMVKDLNMISVAFAVLYIGLGADYIIHVGMRYRELHTKGASRRESMVASIYEIGPSLVLCALSTATGYYAFLPTDFKGISQLGLIAGTSMFISLLLCLTLLPTLMCYFSGGFKVPSSSNPSLHDKIETIFNKLSTIPQKHGKMILFVSLPLLMIGAYGSTQIQFDRNPLNLRNPESEAVSTFKQLEEQGVSQPWRIQLLTNSLEEAKRRAAQLSKLKTVGTTRTVQDLIPKQQKTKLARIEQTASLMEGTLIGTNPTKNKMPDYTQAHESVHEFLKQLKEHPEELSSESMQQIQSLAPERFETEDLKRLHHNLTYYLPDLFENLENSFYPDNINKENLPNKVREQWISEDGLYRVEILPATPLKTNHQLGEFVQSVQAIAPEATGDTVVAWESGRIVLASFQEAMLWAFFVTSIILLVYLRSLLQMAIVLFPLLLSGLLTLTIMNMLGSALNFANIIALPLLLGLGIDNGIHMLHRARTHTAEQDQLLKTSTARAVLFSSLTTIAGFGTLLISPHPGTASMGLLLTVGTITVLLCTLFLLPALFSISQARSASPD